MQANLQSKTFNKHNNIPKNQYANKLRDPYVNRISGDISYKQRSIGNVSRNPVPSSGGPEHLYNQRVVELRRKLKTRQITVEQYNNLLAQAQTQWIGRPVDNDDVIRPVVRRVPRRINSTTSEEVNETNEDEHDKELNNETNDDSEHSGEEEQNDSNDASSDEEEEKNNTPAADVEKKDIMELINTPGN